VTTNPKGIEAVTSRVVQAVREEIRDASMFGGPQCVHELPPPVAIDEERVIVGALLAGHVSLVELLPATPTDFFFDLHSSILVAFEALDATGTTPTRALVVIALRAQGVGGTDEAVIDELCRLENDAPAVVDLARCIGAVVETARRRALSRLLRDADVELRTGKSAAQVSEMLLEAIHG
jgi:hypothetical protein